MCWTNEWWTNEWANGPKGRPYRLDDASNAAANAAEEARCLAAVEELLDADPDVVVGRDGASRTRSTHDLKGAPGFRLVKKV